MRLQPQDFLTVNSVGAVYDRPGFFLQSSCRLSPIFEGLRNASILIISPKCHTDNTNVRYTGARLKSTSSSRTAVWPLVEASPHRARCSTKEEVE